MIDRIKLYLFNKGEYRPDKENSFSPALCNRLDRNTAGLMIAAKNAEALREINSAIRDGLIHKIYRCVTVCPPPENEAVITAWHKKDDGRNIVRITDSPAVNFWGNKQKFKVSLNTFDPDDHTANRLAVLHDPVSLAADESIVSITDAKSIC